MTGVARALLLLLCWGPMQRWLLGIGLAVSAGGLLALSGVWQADYQPLFAIAVIGALACVVVSPALMDGIIFRSLSAARATDLIRHGRLKLLIAAFIAQLLIALFVALVSARLFTAPGFTQGAHSALDTFQLGSLILAVVFALLTVQFIGYFLLCRYRFGALWVLGLAVWPRALASADQRWHLYDLLISAQGLALWLGVLTCVWGVFGLYYLRLRHIGVPSLGSFLFLARTQTRSQAATPRLSPHGQSAQALAFSPRSALRTLLLGMPRDRRVFVVPGLIWVALLVLFVALPMYHLKGNPDNPLAWVPLMIITGPVSGSLATSMTRRARCLWLSCALSRPQVFAEVERYSGLLTGIVVILALSLLLPQLILGVRGVSAALRFATDALLPVASAAGFIYSGMAWIRGHRLVGAGLLAVCSALWLADIAHALGATDLPAPGLLLAVQIICVPLMRRIALHLWRDIDWRVNRPARLPARLA